MSSVDIWSVDRVAAGNLAADLGLDPEGKEAGRIASHFARHRFSAYEWAAERAQANIIGALERGSLDLAWRTEDDDAWRRGYMQAEQVVLTMTLPQLVDVENRKPRSKGQILRAMVRRARASMTE